MTTDRVDGSATDPAAGSTAGSTAGRAADLAVDLASDLASDLREIVEAERQRFGVPGCAVAVVADGRVVLCEGFGTRDLGRGLPVTPRTLFPIASSTKTFTAALCAALVDAGVLAWHRPVREYLPDFRMADPVATAELTVFDMLCHRSGLPRHDLLWYLADGQLDRGDLVAALRHLDFSRGFRETWQYNNILYTAAGVLAGHLAGGSYETALRERVLDPLGMRRTNFSVAATQADDDAARPYVSPEPGAPVTETAYANLDLIAPAGALNSCAAELVPWLLTLLGRGVDGRPPLLSEQVLTTLRTPAMPLPERSLLAVGRPVGYGLGQIVEDYRGHRLVHHGGNIDGFSSQVGLIPDAGCAVAVLANREGTALRDALPCLLYDRLLGLEPRPHGESLLATEEALYLGQSQHRAHITSSSLGLGAVRPLTDYVGSYRHPGYGDLVVTADGDGLRATYRAMSGPLRHRHLEVFTLVAELGGVVTPLPAQFFHNVSGDVTEVALPLEPAVAPIRFARVPDTAHLTDAVLDRLAGTYRLGPLTVTVGRRGAVGLVAALVQGGPQELTPVRGLVFTTADGTRVEFTEDGRLVTSAGEFTRSS